MNNTKIASEEVKKLARLNNFELSDDQAEKFVPHVSQLTDLMQEIENLDVSEVPETVRASSEKNIWHEDKVQASLSQEQALSNADHTFKGYFVVDSVMKDNDVT